METVNAHSVIADLVELIKEELRDEIREMVALEMGGGEPALMVEEAEEKSPPVNKAVLAKEFLAKVKEVVGKDSDRKDQARTILSEKYGKAKFTDVDPELFDECLADLKEIK